jgi:hypothetical protein
MSKRHYQSHAAPITVKSTSTPTTQNLGGGVIYTPAQTLTQTMSNGTTRTTPQPAQYTVNGKTYTQSSQTSISFPNGGNVSLNIPQGQSAFMASDGTYFSATPGKAPTTQPISLPRDPIPQLLGQPNQAFNTIYQGSQNGSIAVKNINGQYTLTDVKGNPVQTGEYVSISPVQNKPGVYQVSFANPASEGSVTGYIATYPNTGVLAPISYENATKQFAYQPGSGGGVFSGLLSAVAPVLPIVAAVAGGGIGGAVADALGITEALTGTAAASLAPQIGSAVVSVASQVAQGTPIEKAVQNAAISSVIQTGSTEVAKTLNTVIQNPTVSNAIGSAVSSAAQASLSGGNSDTAITSALLGAGTSLVTSGGTSTKTSQEPSTTVQPGETTGPLAGPTGSIGALAEQTPATGGGLTTEAAAGTPSKTTAEATPAPSNVPSLPPIDVTAPATPVSTLLAQGLGTNLGVNPATPSLPPISVTAPSEPTANVSTVTISPSTGNVPQLKPIVATLPQQTPGAPGNVTTVTVPELDPIVARLPSTPQLEPISVTAKPDANVSTVTISAGEGNAATGNATSNTSTYEPEITTITSARQGQNLFKPSTTYAPTQTGVSPGSAALAQALNVGDLSAPIFDKTGKKPRNVWNQASLRVKDETGT